MIRIFLREYLVDIAPPVQHTNDLAPHAYHPIEDDMRADRNGTQIQPDFVATARPMRRTTSSAVRASAAAA
jgi:hypothetical protein